MWTKAIDFKAQNMANHFRLTFVQKQGKIQIDFIVLPPGAAPAFKLKGLHPEGTCSHWHQQSAMAMPAFS
jgi:hypothetical protein